MTESVGDKAINDSAASASEDSVYTLAHVLECEFSELHQGDLPKVTHEALGQDRTAVMEAKQQQPLADPSLSPANHQARAQCMEHPETDKTPSQQLDSDPDAKALRNLWERVHGLAGDGRTALCLSGGGVRSAAFNLGVLQGLARLELLDCFHYLSTVSGGGYIGCWLSAWRYRCEKGISDVIRGLSWPDRIGDAEVPPRAPDAISNLRRASNYLTPLKGILSPDTWATITVVGRNLILNHLIIVPLIAALLFIVKVLDAVAHVHDSTLFAWEKWTNDLIGAWLHPWLADHHLGSLLLPGVFVALGWIVFSIARPSWDVRRPSLPTNTIAAATTSDRESLAQTWAPRSGIAFVLLGAVIFAFLAAKSIPQAASSWSWERLAVFPLIGAVGALVAFVLALCVAATKRVLCKSPKTVRWAVRYLGHVPEVPPGPVTVPTAGVHAVLLLALGVVAAGGAGGLVLGVGEELAAYLPKNNPWSTALVLSIAPLWFVISYNVGDAVFLGLTVRRPSPRKKLDWSDRWGDEEREWVARTGGSALAFFVFWRSSVQS
jgi:Patatin-like phospholipase